MDNFNWLLQGFAEAATPMNLLYAVIGVLLGTAVGVLPGIGPAMTVALLLPITYNVSPSAAFIMFAGIFYGGMYGGSTTSILLNTPGESSSVITAIEGNKMAKAGRAAQALATAAIGSFVAGAIGTTLLAAFAPPISQIRGHTRCAVLSRDHAVRPGRGHRGAWRLQASRGDLAVSRLGDRRRRHRLPHGPATCDVRHAAALRRHRHRGDRGRDLRSRRGALGGGASAAPSGRRHPGRPAVDGPRRLAAVLEAVAARHRVTGSRSARCRPAAPSCRRSCPTSPRSGCPSIQSEFGKGAIEGVAGPEAANNASAAGTLVPMLSLGLPTNATAAVMLTAFVSYGIQPGPTLFEKEPLLIWTLIASLFIGNFLLLVINLPLAPLWAKLLRTPRPYLYAGILFFATLGALAVNVQALDLALLLVFGLVGLMMRRFGLPVLPLIIGVILGPRIERQLRQSLQLGGGDWGSLFTEPVAIVVYV